MDGIDTSGILNILKAKSLLVADLETEEAMKFAKFPNDPFFPESLYQEFLDWISSVACCSILHKRNNSKRIFFMQTWNNLFA